MTQDEVIRYFEDLRAEIELNSSDSVKYLQMLDEIYDEYCIKAARLGLSETTLRMIREMVHRP